MDLRGRSVFVTGATGFLGTHLVDVLLERGATVSALVRPRTPAADLEARGVRVVRGDVTDLMSIDASGAEVFFHNAALVGFGLPRRHRKRLHEVNAEGTRNALTAATRAGCRRFVLTSSIAAIGDTRGEVADESFPRSPWYKSEYERSKLEAHLLVQAWREGGLETVAGMPGVILGHGGPFDPLMGALARGRLPVLPKGDKPTGFVHVRDAAEGLVLAAEKGTGPYLLVDENLTTAELFTGVANRWGVPAPRARVGTGALMALATVAQAAWHLVGGVPPLSREHVVSLRASMQYDSGKARRELGWQPRMWERLEAERSRYA